MVLITVVSQRTQGYRMLRHDISQGRCKVITVKQCTNIHCVWSFLYKSVT